MASRNGAGGNDPYARELARQAKERERERKAAEANAKRKVREDKLAYEATQVQKAVDRTSVTEHDAEQLSTLLRSAVLDSRPPAFERFRQVFVPSVFAPKATLSREMPVPRLEEYEPEPPRGLLGALGFKRRAYEADVEAARERFDRALRDHARDEQKRAEKLKKARDRHEERNQEEAARVAEWNARIDERHNAYRDRDVEAVEWYVDKVLAASAYPHGFPKTHQVSYQADTGDLLVEIDLPLEGVVPAARAFRYVKLRDEITPIARPEKERKELYASVLAQTALRTVHELFAADTEGVVQSIALNGHVATIDRATGRDVHPCLITLQADREEFGQLVLTQVDPRACLKRLRSLISPNPYELEPVRPLVTFDLTKFRLMDSMDVVAGLDSRPVLMDLTPTEFEHLVRQLFEAIGLDSVNTQPSQDEGVDAIAMNTDPVMKGLCIIQAKRTKNVVPFETVSALAGVVEHKRAAKGILVTTSWFGRRSEAFANEHGRLELLDGGNLVHLFKEHLNLDVIPGPVPPRNRPR
ncbi:restriction endonuclease [Streptomyces sp. H10-C2]|uniref:restriction endonuclease n=1 Tax=unclassified Streptomyces TaxID=2593676 RepID=UPI0024B8C3A3|nr:MULTISPECIES: restriction endonuclease [unclassified Streptomyces]MDJ0342642.1 restriction endonuclease [Streptomyces sp. PH10-H1]MDJ0368504.1 restriction endonuclease [Streptomyces sp. H10-C2]